MDSPWKTLLDHYPPSRHNIALFNRGDVGHENGAVGSRVNTNQRALRKGRCSVAEEEEEEDGQAARAGSVFHGPSTGAVPQNSKAPVGGRWKTRSRFSQGLRRVFPARRA